MVLRVSEILAQKISEIQSRVPLRIAGFKRTVQFSADNSSFQSALEAAQEKLAGESQSVSKLANVLRARAALEKSSAYIPGDKDQLMEMIDSAVNQASQKYGVDPSLVKAVIKQESAYNPYALSRSGAQGLMQLMPDTAQGLGVTDPWDIYQNIDGGVRYLKAQMDSFGDLPSALAAYNAGPNSVRRYNGIPPYEETQNYVTKVLEYYKMFSSEQI